MGFLATLVIAACTIVTGFSLESSGESRSVALHLEVWPLSRRTRALFAFLLHCVRG